MHAFAAKELRKQSDGCGCEQNGHTDWACGEPDETGEQQYALACNARGCCGCDPCQHRQGEGAYQQTCDSNPDEGCREIEGQGVGGSILQGHESLQCVRHPASRDAEGWEKEPGATRNVVDRTGGCLGDQPEVWRVCRNCLAREPAADTAGDTGKICRNCPTEESGCRGLQP